MTLPANPNNNITLTQSCPCGWQATVSVSGRDLSYQRVGEMAIALLREHPHHTSALDQALASVAETTRGTTHD